MSTDPYTPPQAIVADALPSVEMPRAVRIATMILWVQVGAVAAKALLPFWRGENHHVTALGTSVLVLAGFSFLIYKIAHRRNWARMVYTAFGVVGLLGMGSAYLRGTVPFSWMRVASLGVTIACVVLLNSRQSREWFLSKAATERKNPPPRQ